MKISNFLLGYINLYRKIPRAYTFHKKTTATDESLFVRGNYREIHKMDCNPREYFSHFLVEEQKALEITCSRFIQPRSLSNG